MKKLFIGFLVFTLMLSGCQKKIDYTQAISDLKQQYASDSVLTQTVSSFVNAAIDKAKEYGDIQNIGFMAADSFEKIQNYVEEHKDTVKYVSLGIGAVVIVGGTVVLVVKTACIAGILTLIANKLENNEKIQLAVSSFENIMNGKNEKEESNDLKDSLEDGYIVMLNGASE